MAADQFEVKTFLPASPATVYRAWLTGREHARMTGGAAARGEPTVGTTFTAWDGYIEGKNLELEPGRRILQSWRTSEFPAEAPDSRLEVLLTAERGGTRLVLRHSEIPPGQGASYREGWADHYFEPMKRYFAKKPAAARTRRSAARKSTAARKKR